MSRHRPNIAAALVLCAAVFAAGARGNLEIGTGEAVSLATGETRAGFPAGEAIRRDIAVGAGQTLDLILTDNGVAHSEAVSATRALSRVANLRRLRVGQEVALFLAPRPRPEVGARLVGLVLALRGGGAAAVFRDFDDRFQARRAPRADAIAMLESIHVVGGGDAPGFANRDLRLGKGENLAGLLAANGAAPGDVEAAARLLGRAVDLRRLAIGQKVTAIFERGSGGAPARLAGLVLAAKDGGTHMVGRGADGRWRPGPPAAGAVEPAADEAAAEEAEEDTAAVDPSPVSATPAAGAAKVARLVFAEGETLADLLARAGAGRADIHAAARGLAGVFNPRRIRAGWKMAVAIAAADGKPELAWFALEARRGGFRVERGRDGRYRAARIDSGDLERALAGGFSAPTAAEARAASRALPARLGGARRAALAAETVRVALARGATLSHVLLDAGFSAQEAHLAAEAAAELHDPRGLKAGDVVEYVRTEAAPGAPAILGAVRFDIDATARLHAVRLEDGRFVAGIVEKDLRRAHRRAEARIDSSLYVAARDADIPVPVVMDLIGVFSYSVDFQRDIQPGDRVSAVFETLVDADGAEAEPGAVLYASLVRSGKPLTLYRYERADGRVDYFDAQGESARRALMRTPIDGARLTSRFGKRRHPISGYNRMHRGVDFGAPTGTPIYAAGDGAVERASWHGGYGRYVRIRHNNSYKTAYAHLSAYADGLHPGKRVRQGEVIGYVGSSGQSTGPHLHYEVIYNDRQVNPLSVEIPAGDPLEGPELAEFAETRRALDVLAGSLPLAEPALAEQAAPRRRAFPDPFHAEETEM